MAYDPEARQTGNSAMTISIVALVLLAGAVLAWYATRPNEAVTNSTTIVNQDRPDPVTNTVVVESAPNTVVVEKPVPVPGTDRTIVRDTKTTTTNNVVTTPRSGGSSGGSGTPNVTTNVTVTPPTSSSSAGGGSGSGSSASDSGDAGSSAAPSDSATGNAELPPPAP